MTTQLLAEVASDLVILLLIQRALKGDLAAISFALLIFPFLSRMTGAATVAPLYVVTALALIAFLRAPPVVNRVSLRLSPESLLLLLLIVIFAIAIIELVVGRSALRGSDTSVFTHLCLCGTVFPVLLIVMAVKQMPVRSAIVCFASMGLFGGGTLLLAAMAGWMIDPLNDFGYSYGRYRIFGTDTITSGLLVTLVATCGVVWMFLTARRGSACVAVLALCAAAIFLIGNTQNSLVFYVLVCLLSARLFAMRWLALTAIVAGSIILAASLMWKEPQTSSSEEGASHSINELPHILNDFAPDDGSRRLGQAVESLHAAWASPIAGNGFNSWRGGETFFRDSTDRNGFTLKIEISSYPHGTIPSIMNDRGLFIGSAAVILVFVVFVRAVHTAVFASVCSPPWSASVLFVCLPLGGAWFSGLYWTSGTLLVPLTLLVFARASTSTSAAASQD